VIYKPVPTSKPEMNNYVRYIREVKPSEEVEGFVAVLGHATKQIFGDKAAVLKRHSESVPQPSRRSKNKAAIGVPAVKIYPAERIRLTHLEILVPSLEFSKRSLLSRLLDRSEAIIESTAFNDEMLDVNGSSLKYQVQSGYQRLGEEILLEIDYDENSVILDEQNKILVQRVTATGAGNDLRDYIQAPTLTLAVGRLPVVSQEQLSEYEDKKDKLTIFMKPYLPLMGIELCPITISDETRK
jgi:hypothetical protein